jgi:phosphate-selective porin
MGEMRVSKVRSRRTLGAVALLMALSSPGAFANGDAPTQTDPSAGKPADAVPADPVKEGWRRDGLGFKKGDSKIELAGYAQGDFRSFDWEPQETDLGPLRAEESELARLRIGLKAEFGPLFFEFVADPRNSRAGDRLKDVTVGYKFSKKAVLLAGHFKPEVSAEFLTSGSRTDFIDRSMAADRLAPDREWGAAISGEAGKFWYGIGGFRGDGSSASQSAGASVATRVTYEAVKGLVLGGSFMQGKVEPDARIGSREPSPKGGQGRTPSGFNFWDRAHVNGTRQRLGGDAAYSRGPFRIIGEYLELGEQRLGQGSTGQDIPDVKGRGWSVQATYVLTGEKKGDKVVPAKSVFQGGKGALEIAARIEGLKFDDTGDPSGFAGYGNRTRNIAPSAATVVAGGLNYWASSFLKFQGNAIWESYNDPLIAPVPGNKGRYFTLIGRIQVMVP